MLLSHLRAYLSETTVHGFRYTVEGRNRAERLFWVVAILVAFAYSLYFGVSSIREAQVNPVVSSIEIADSGELTFPAVTLMDTSNKDQHFPPHRFVTNALNAVLFDCSDKDDECRRNSDQVRLDFASLIRNFVLAVHASVDVLRVRFKDVLDDQPIRNDRSHLPSNLTFAFCALERLLNHNAHSERGSQYIKILTQSDEEKVLEFMVANFRTPDEYFAGGFYRLSQDILDDNNVTKSLHHEIDLLYSNTDDGSFPCGRYGRGGTRARDFHGKTNIVHWRNVFLLLVQGQMEVDLGDLLEYSYLSCYSSFERTAHPVYPGLDDSTSVLRDVPLGTEAVSHSQLFKFLTVYSEMSRN